MMPGLGTAVKQAGACATRRRRATVQTQSPQACSQEEVMRTMFTVVAALAVAVPAAAQGRDDPDTKVAGGGALPAGWSARTDRGQPLANVHFRPMGGGLHVTLGPAVILYRDADAARGSYEVNVTYVQTAAPAHPESYGLFIGGSALQGSDQRYTYFLVRGNGQFLVKRRTGGQTSNLSDGWTAHAAVKAQDADGKATNALSIVVGPERVSFRANGTEVFTAARGDVDADGIAGLRVNHNLDLHIDGFAVKKKM